MKKKKVKELERMHNIKLIFQELQKIIKDIGGNFGIKQIKKEITSNLLNGGNIMKKGRIIIITGRQELEKAQFHQFQQKSLI